MQPVPPGPGVRIATPGSSHPRWRADASEVVYQLNGKLMAVALHPHATTIEVGATTALFDLPKGTTDWALAPDGRFLLVLPSGPAPEPTEWTALVNWTKALGKQ